MLKRKFSHKIINQRKFSKGTLTIADVDTMVNDKGAFRKDWINNVLGGEEEAKAEKLYEGFITDLTHYMNDNDITDLTPTVLDHYAQDNEAQDYNELIDMVHDWVATQDDYISSLEYAREIYAYENGAADTEFYCQDIETYAEEYWRNDEEHGFDSLQDMIYAIKECCKDGDIEDVVQYDGETYGWRCDPTDYPEYCIVGELFLGNSEEEWQLQDEVPFDEKWQTPWTANVYRDFAIRGDCIYSPNYTMLVYGVPWEKVEAKNPDNRIFSRKKFLKRK
jgi:hypothetical protein